MGTSRYGTVTNTIKGLRSRENSNKNSVTDKADLEQFGQEPLAKIVSVIIDETDETNLIGVV